MNVSENKNNQADLVLVTGGTGLCGKSCHSPAPAKRVSSSDNSSVVKPRRRSDRYDEKRGDNLLVGPFVY